MNQLQNKSFEEALVRYREKWDRPAIICQAEISFGIQGV